MISAWLHRVCKNLLSIYSGHCTFSDFEDLPTRDQMWGPAPHEIDPDIFPPPPDRDPSAWPPPTSVEHK